MNLPLLDCCLSYRGSRNHHRPVCIYSPHIVFGFPFCLWLCSFRFCDSAAHLLVCRAKEMAGIAASFIHVLPRLPFYLWLKLYSSCESAVAPFPCLPCGKVLATVILASRVCRPRKWWTAIFFSPEGFPFSDSSGVFYLFKGYSNRAPSEITLYPLTSPWAGLIIGNLWQIALNKFWALQQTGSSCNNTVPIGPIVGCCALGFS